MKNITLSLVLLACISGLFAQKNEKWCEEELERRIAEWSLKLYKAVDAGTVKTYKIFPSETLLTSAQIKERIAEENKVQEAGAGNWVQGIIIQYSTEFKNANGILSKQASPQWISPAYNPMLSTIKLPLAPFVHVKTADAAKIFTADEFAALNALGIICADVFSFYSGEEMQLTKSEKMAANAGIEPSTSRLTNISPKPIAEALFKSLKSSIFNVQDNDKAFKKGAEIFFRDPEFKSPYKRSELDSFRMIEEMWQIVNPDNPNDIFDLVDTMLLIKSDVSSWNLQFVKGGLQAQHEIYANKSLYIRMQPLSPYIPLPFRLLISNVYLKD